MSRPSTIYVSSYNKKVLTSFFLVLNTLMCLDSFNEDDLGPKYLKVLNDYKSFCEDFISNLETLIEESKISSSFIKKSVMSRVSKILHAFAFKRVESVCEPFMVLNLFVYIKDRLDESSDQAVCLASWTRNLEMSSIDVYGLLDIMYDVLSECVASKVIEASEHVCDSLCLEFEL